MPAPAARPAPQRQRCAERESYDHPSRVNGIAAEVLELVQAKRPILAIDEDEIEVELPQNVDHRWGWEGKIVAVCLAPGTHRGFDSFRLLHRLSSCVWRLPSDRPILSVLARWQRPNSAPGEASPPR